MLVRDDPLLRLVSIDDAQNLVFFPLVGLDLHLHREAVLGQHVEPGDRKGQRLSIRTCRHPRHEGRRDVSVFEADVEVPLLHVYVKDDIPGEPLASNRFARLPGDAGRLDAELLHLLIDDDLDGLIVLVLRVLQGACPDDGPQQIGVRVLPREGGGELRERPHALEAVPGEHLVPGGHREGQIRTRRQGHLLGNGHLLDFGQAVPVRGVRERDDDSSTGPRPVRTRSCPHVHQVPVRDRRQVGRPVRRNPNVNDVDMAAPAGVGDPVLLRQAETVPVRPQVRAFEERADVGAGIGPEPDARRAAEPVINHLVRRIRERLIRHDPASGRNRRQGQKTYEPRSPELTTYHDHTPRLHGPSERDPLRCGTPRQHRSFVSMIGSYRQDTPLDERD